VHETTTVNFVAKTSGTVIEAFGSTSLVQVGHNFYLDNISTGTGPELKLNGTPFSAGQSGAWTPIGVEATATGYEVAWKAGSADQYSVWNTNSSGNYIANAIGVVSGSSSALENFETSFHQDLNGDGVIGVPSKTTAASGAAPEISGLQSHTTPLVVANNDTFVFNFDAAAAARAEAVELAQSSLASLLVGPHSQQPLTAFQSEIFDSGGATDHGSHDSAPSINFHFADPHAGHFIIS
jgi:hypothetical protein